MPKYTCTVTATLDVEAHDVIQAADAATYIRLIGQHYGGRYLVKTRDPVFRRVSVRDFHIGTPILQKDK